MLELKKSVLAVKVDGQEYQIKFPTIKTIKMFQDKVKSLGGENDLEATLDFLASLGLPKEIGEELEPAHLASIIDVISGSKKN
jgi:hypothetical protein